MKKLAKIISLLMFAGVLALPAMARSSIQERIEKQLNATQEAFFDAVARGDEATVAQMMNRDSKLLHAQDENGWTPLMVAVSYAADPEYTGKMPDDRYLGIVQRMLILNGGREANVNAKKKDGMTALMLAVRSNDVEIVSQLLRTEGIDTQIRDENGRTALFYAVNFRNSYHDKSRQAQERLVEDQYQIVAMLLRKGAKVNLKDKDGVTPLMIAVDYLNYDASQGSHIVAGKRDNLKAMEKRLEIVRLLSARQRDDVRVSMGL